MIWAGSKTGTGRLVAARDPGAQDLHHDVHRRSSLSSIALLVRSGWLVSRRSAGRAPSPGRGCPCARAIAQSHSAGDREALDRPGSAALSDSERLGGALVKAARSIRRASASRCPALPGLGGQAGSRPAARAAPCALSEPRSAASCEPVEGAVPALRPAGAHRLDRRQQGGGVGAALRRRPGRAARRLLRIGIDAVAGHQPRAERELRFASPRSPRAQLGHVVAASSRRPQRSFR